MIITIFNYFSKLKFFYNNKMNRRQIMKYFINDLTKKEQHSITKKVYSELSENDKKIIDYCTHNKYCNSRVTISTKQIVNYSTDGIQYRRKIIADSLLSLV